MLQPKTTPKKDKFLNNKNLRMFLLSLLMSFIFWLLINLSKESTSVANFSLSYYNLPHSKVIQNAALIQLKLELKARGFKFLSYQLNKQEIRINLEHIKHLKNSKYYYLPNNYLRELQSQLPENVNLLSVINDTIFLDLTIIASKKVKVVPNLDINFKTGFNFANPMKVTPDSVEIQGPKAWLDTITRIGTEALHLKDLAQDINQLVALKMIKNDKLVYSKSAVNIKIEVDKFTETSLLANFTILNLPNNYQIYTIPKEVTIKYQVSLSNYKSVNASMFAVQCDFALSQRDNLNYLIPIIIKKPGFISMAKIFPEKIEYIIKK